MTVTFLCGARQGAAQTSGILDPKLFSSRHQLKVRFKRKNLCDGFLKDCLNFADDYLSLGRLESMFQLALRNQNVSYNNQRIFFFPFCDRGQF